MVDLYFYNNCNLNSNNFIILYLSLLLCLKIKILLICFSCNNSVSLKITNLNFFINYFIIFFSNFYENLEKNIIKFENYDINVIIDDNDIIWFNANEIAISLGYIYPKDAIINNVEKEDKLKLENININYKIKKHPHSIYINESGLYSLLLLSRLDKAKKFKLWITKTILPSIRKFGYYKLKKEHESNIHEIIKKINFLEKQNDKLKNELKIEKYPDGSLIYIVDYTDEQSNMYRIKYV